MMAASIARLDLARLVASKRWLAVVAIWVAICLLAESQLVVRSEATGLAANAWDIRFVAVNNWMYVSYMLLLAFVFLVGDTLSSDRATGWATALLTRASGTGPLWMGKAVFVAAASVLYQLAFLAFTLVYGFARGLSVAPSPSPVASGSLEELALFAPVTGSLAQRLLASLLHETVGFAAIALLFIAVCARSRRSSATVAVALVAAIIDWVLAQRLTLFEMLSPGRRLLEGIHLDVPGMQGGVAWSSTAAYLAALLIAGLVIGRVSTRGLEY